MKRREDLKDTLHLLHIRATIYEWEEPTPQIGVKTCVAQPLASQTLGAVYQSRACLS